LRIIAQLAHQSQLISKAIFALAGRKTGLLRKGLHCELFTVFDSLNLIYSREVALPQLSERFETLVETLLVELFAQLGHPHLHDLPVSEERTLSPVLSVEPETDLRGSDVGLTRKTCT
jgi:hypothetical protein